MIDLDTAGELLDFGTRIGAGPRAREQLEGAVALHRLLHEQRVAYLADEVGMGKTYVALGALALFRHFQPDFRVLVIAPRENIQNKWMKELRNFVTHNVRFADMRVKALDGRPARPLVSCGSLIDFVHEAVLDPNRDFFMRMTSFSLGVGGRDGTVDTEAARKLRERLKRYLPWLRDEALDLRAKQSFKDNVARAVCCALPVFDLVIVDEAHNLKHGFAENVSARNRVLSLAFGHPTAVADPGLFPHYGPRARRVLFLSATPIEETYTQLWNQLDIFGLSGGFDELQSSGVDEEHKKAVAGRFLLRRVSAIKVGSEEYTKNLYRREWRRGGVRAHDEPIRIDDPRQRLVVALVQKKVSELLGGERFKTSFQIGMLASFESFLETAKLKQSDEEGGNFDDTEQTADALEREGIDVADVNRLARSYRERFGVEMPHPKMDALVESLSGAWRQGRKSLVFVRRVASVKELKRKLDERYDAWLLGRLRRELPEAVRERFEQAVARYHDERRRGAAGPGPELVPQADEHEVDPGGMDTFFAWYFRGEGPRGLISGANVQQRFIQRGAVYSTFFEDNQVAVLLGCLPGEVEGRLARALGIERSALRTGLRERSKRFLSRAKKHARADRFEAVQAAAVEWLKECPGAHQESARRVWHERFESSLQVRHAQEAPDIGDWLELKTFFTELRLRPELRERLWPEPKTTEPRKAFRERELRAQLLASAARLGHSLIDLYVLTIRHIGSLDLRAQQVVDTEAVDDVDVARITDYLDLIERQMRTPLAEREWGVFDELADLAEHFDLVLDVNAPESREQLLAQTAKAFGQLLRQQQPTGGMAGQVNQTLVRQFRMPGYPLVLVTTDLLQEGEDLHTFCSSVHHYGISWTPSSMEQRIGRIDRVRSQADRRLSVLDRAPRGEDLLQVYFPHLEDTVEVLQVQRVLERMNVFLRLMHEGLTTAGPEERRIDTSKEFVRGPRVVPQLRERLKSAFPVRPEHLRGEVRGLAVGPEVAKRLEERFQGLRHVPIPGLEVEWEPQAPPGVLLGTVHLGARQQPFSLRLQSLGERPLVRCISPVGCVGPDAMQESIMQSVERRVARVGVVLAREDRTYDLTVEEDVLLGEDASTDGLRLGLLLRRVVRHADTLEQIHLPGQDERLGTFRDELEKEGQHGR
jgi:hypothetical protein